MALVNTLQAVSRAGIKPNTRYKAKVIANEDDRMLGRIKFQIEYFLELEEEDAPWAIPMYNGSDGATVHSGFFVVPKIDSFVCVEFQEGSVYHPIYYPMFLDEKVILEDGDAKANYPDRLFFQLSNKFKMYIDTKNDAFYIENPGDMKLYVKGSLNVQVDQNAAVLVKGNMTAMVDKDLEVTVKGDAAVAIDGNCNILSAKTVSITGDNMIYLDGGSGDYSGIITEKSICPYTNTNHADPSKNIFASMG